MRRLAVLVALLPSVAMAQYFYLNFKNLSSASKQLPFYVDNRAAAPGGVGVAPMRASVEAAWSTWNAVSCAVPKAQAKGFSVGTVTRPADTFDLFNVTPVWLTSQSDPDFANTIGSSYTIAITLPVSYAGVMQTCDTFFNGADYTWSVLPTTAASDMDVETVMLHEAGHCLGLDHQLGFYDAVMNASIPAGKQQRTLAVDDVSALCQRYPLSGAVGAPCLADGGCGGAAAIKCVTQNLGTAGSAKFCTQGCTINAGTSCELPLSCQSSSSFTPGFNGACLLPGTSVTQVGRACTGAADCLSSNAECLSPSMLPSGNELWAQGYCSQTCEAGQAPCPVGSTCMSFSDNSRHCLKACRPGLADCRSQYACVGTSAGGVCQPRCFANEDCSDPANFDCRTCDGLCVSKQSPTGQIGDPCTLDGDCGAGQLCLQTDNRQAQKSCTAQCGRGCGVCPAGSTCYPLALGDLYCLKDCAGPGTCPEHMRCGDFSAGKACLPACHATADCPVGQSCLGGDCLTPANLEDGGPCGALCAAPDAGKPVVAVPRDAGAGIDHASAGCGCAASPAEFSLVLLAWAAALASRRFARGRP